MPASHYLLIPCFHRPLEDPQISFLCPCGNPRGQIFPFLLFLVEVFAELDVNISRLMWDCSEGYRKKCLKKCLVLVAGDLLDFQGSDLYKVQTLMWVWSGCLESGCFPDAGSFPWTLQYPKVALWSHRDMDWERETNAELFVLYLQCHLRKS